MVKAQLSQADYGMHARILGFAIGSQKGFIRPDSEGLFERLSLEYKVTREELPSIIGRMAEGGLLEYSADLHGYLVTEDGEAFSRKTQGAKLKLMLLLREFENALAGELDSRDIDDAMLRVGGALHALEGSRNVNKDPAYLYTLPNGFDILRVDLSSLTGAGLEERIKKLHKEGR